MACSYAQEKNPLFTDEEIFSEAKSSKKAKNELLWVIALYLKPSQTAEAFKAISNFNFDLLQIIPTMIAKLSIDHKYLGVDQTVGMIGISPVL